MDGHFAGKLDVVLKALALSRGRLAADLAVDKSVVSRWLAGKSTPSGENLSQLTRLIAQRVPGFTGLDWDRDLPAMAGLFGTVSMASDTPSGPQLPRLDAVRDRIARHRSSWEGHYWGYRQTFRDHDEFVRDKVRIRPRGDFLIFEWAHDVVEGEGWFMAGDGKAYATLDHRFADIPAFFAFFTMDGKPMQVIDGMVTTVTISAAREMIAAPYVMVRHADLHPDPVTDDALFQARTPDEWGVAADSLDPTIRDRLTPVVRHGVLRIPSDISLARFATAAEREAALAVTNFVS